MTMSLAQAYLELSQDIPLSDPKVEQRLGRGYEIVRANGSGYSIVSLADGTYQVIKASTSLLDTNPTVYMVSRQSCNCPDNATARAGLCKHRLAILLYEKMYGLVDGEQQYAN